MGTVALMEWQNVLIIMAFGLVIGSFLNVVISRLPLEKPEDRSLNGRSRCPQCRNPIAAYDNIPVLSWLILRGKCRHCKNPIPARYPLVEVLTCVLWGAVAANTDQIDKLVPGLIFITLLIPITFIDLDHRIIPNVLSVPGMVVGLVVGISLDPSRWLELLVSAFGAGFVLLAIALIRPGGMGMGDVKLVAMMGAFVGKAIAFAMFAGFILALFPSLWLLARHGSKARKMAIPFGPFLAGGGLLAWFWGEQLLDLWLSAGAA